METYHGRRYQTEHYGNRYAGGVCEFPLKQQLEMRKFLAPPPSHKPTNPSAIRSRKMTHARTMHSFIMSYHPMNLHFFRAQNITSAITATHASSIWAWHLQYTSHYLQKSTSSLFNFVIVATTIVNCPTRQSLLLFIGSLHALIV